ncbi:MAG: methionine--tRNA ligase [Candidatus Aenigmatarchaeota archaeon]
MVVNFKPKFFVTTPIYYINAPPHIGHAYTTIAADILARFNRLKGRDVFFLTGLDENSVKTVQAAKEKGMEIKKYADEMAEKWKNVWRILNISNDDFIRTTEKRHEKNVKKFFMRVFKNGDVYKGVYEGLYCDGCEAFLSENDLLEGKCPLHKKEPRVVKEENYFFRLSKYKEEILKYIENNPDFIRPNSRREEVLSFISSGLKDISISRPGLNWGIRLPIDKKHVFWVWFDALLNYLIKKKYWPASVQLIAKDILRFHAVIWPAMLLSAGYKLPEKIFAHGFLTVNKEKISKSLGNAIDPVYLAEKYSVDALRYFLFREVSFGEDGDFSENSLKMRLNEELVANIGNFINRALSFTWSRFDGIVPRPEKYDEYDKEFLIKIKEVSSTVSEEIEELRIDKALGKIVDFSTFCNQYFQQKEPWKKIENSKCCVYLSVNAVRSMAILLEPFIPYSSEKIWKNLNLPGSVHKQKWKSIFKLKIKPGHKINRPEIIFKKVE